MAENFVEKWAIAHALLSVFLLNFSKPFGICGGPRNLQLGGPLSQGIHDCLRNQSGLREKSCYGTDLAGTCPSLATAQKYCHFREFNDGFGGIDDVQTV